MCRYCGVASDTSMYYWPENALHCYITLISMLSMKTINVIKLTAKGSFLMLLIKSNFKLCTVHVRCKLPGVKKRAIRATNRARFETKFVAYLGDKNWSEGS